MFLAQIQFPLDSSDKEDDAQNIIWSVLAAMIHNGQIVGREHLLLKSPHGFASFVNIPADDALQEQHHNVWVKKSIESFIQIGGKSPTFAVVGEHSESEKLCDCSEISGFILCTDFLSLESPLRCAHCFGTVPLYRITPTHESEHWGARAWESNYKSCDTLQMGCTVLEATATREMSDLKSDLTKSGLKVCRLIAASTKCPVYYYLYAFDATDLAADEARKCPGCGGDWLLEKPWHDRFDFKCDNCHLLSNIVWEVREKSD